MDCWDLPAASEPQKCERFGLGAVALDDATTSCLCALPAAGSGAMRAKERSQLASDCSFELPAAPQPPISKVESKGEPKNDKSNEPEFNLKGFNLKLNEKLPFSLNK